MDVLPYALILPIVLYECVMMVRRADHHRRRCLRGIQLQLILLDRPIFLSIGYAACHWCHVMEHESFEDREVAEVLNRYYVAIKVDREERPDIDAIYMSALQELTGSGGWPMTVWLTADRQPFYGGTYFPPRDGVRGAGTGFLTVLKKLAVVYHDQPQKVAEAAQVVYRHGQLRHFGRSL